MDRKLFTPISIMNLTLSNRIVVAPMCQYSAVNGSATDWHLMHLGQLSISGSSLIFVEATAVEEKGRITPGCLGLYSDDNQKALSKIIEFVKRYGNTKIGIQLAHAGRKASTQVPWKGGTPLNKDNTDSWQTVAPSSESYNSNWPLPVELNEEGLENIKKCFVKSAKRAVEIGFDIIELHMAHGYLIHQFLSPISNKRKDKYGSCFENRIRYPLEIFKAIREEISTDYPVGVRFSATDWVENSSWDLREATQFAMKLKALGCDFFDVSSGGNSPKQEIISGPSYQTGFASHIKNKVGVPTIAVGQINEPLQAESIISTGQADMIAIGRGMLYNPRWAWHAAEVFKKECAYPPQYARAHHSLIGLPIPGNPQSK